MAHYFKSRVATDSDVYRQTRSAANVDEIENVDDEVVINPHMPKYITNAPWYLNKDKPTLKHQRNKVTHKVPLDHWYNRGVKKAKKITKFRKGSCKNCGANTHDAKSCMDRPRKKTAKNLNKTFGEDEDIQDLNLTFEAKIDRWNGFTPEMYNKEVIEEYNRVDDERKRLKAEQLEEKLKEKADKPKNEMDDMMSDSDLEDSDGDLKQDKVDDNDPELAKNPRIKSLNKNLRMRGDTVKYLRNIWDDKAHYDGKSRAMRVEAETVEGQEPVMTEKERLKTGEYLNLMDQDNFVQQAKDKGDVELNTVAMPSQAELAFRNFNQNKKVLMTEKQKELFEKYGGEEHEMPEDIKQQVVEEQKKAISEFQKQNALKKAEKKKLMEQENDIYPNGHTYPWGSFKHPTFGEGYKWCYGFDKDERCRGEKGVKEFFEKEYELKYGKKADKNAEEKRKQEIKETQKKETQEQMGKINNLLKEVVQEKGDVSDSASESGSSSSGSSSGSSSSGSDDGSSSSSGSSSGSSSSSSSRESSPKRKREKKAKRKNRDERLIVEGQELDPAKLQEAIEKEKNKKRRRNYNETNDKRYNSLQANDTTITAEELEAYKMQREMFDDPMKNYKDKEE